MILQNLKKQKLAGSVVLVALIASLTCIFSLSPVANAADVPAYRLQISPTQANLGELTPGSTYTGTFKVQNTGQNDFNYKLSIAPYSVQGANYDPDFTTTNEYTELMDWITLSVEEGSVAANSQADIEFEVTVPENAPGKAQSAAILVTLVEEADMDSTGVQTIRQAAFPIYSNVSGLTIKTGSILENKIPGFIFEPPITATSVVENTGNIYTVAKYTLEVRELFGDKLVYTNAEEANGEIIFPETERYNEVSWENAPQLGIFKVKQTIKIFDEESVVERLVFLCPIWFLCVIIAFVAILVFMIVSRILKRRAA